MIVLSSLFIDLTSAAVKIARGEKIMVWHPEDGPHKTGNTTSRFCLCGGVLHRKKYSKPMTKWCHELGLHVTFVACIYDCQSCGALLRPHMGGVLAYLRHDASTLKATVEAYMKCGGKAYTTAQILNRRSPESPLFEPTWVRRKIRKLRSVVNKFLSERETARRMGLPRQLINQAPELSDALARGQGPARLGSVAVGIWSAVTSLRFYARCGARGQRAPPTFSIPPLWL
jgi:hypothetical protein